MAAVGDSSMEKFVECPVCYEVFVSPQSLDCRHTLCKRCVDTIKGKYTVYFYIFFGSKIAFIMVWAHMICFGACYLVNTNV